MSYHASGLRAWIWQRVSAIVLGIFILLLAGWFAWGDYPMIRILIEHAPVAALIGLFWGALLAHSWVGMRDIILDYVAHRGLRYTFLAGLALWLLSLGIWILIILTRVGFWFLIILARS